MTDELDLFDADPFWLDAPSTRIEKEFAGFHRENPHVYRRLEARALDLWERRHPPRIGIRMLWEVMRYDITLETTGSLGFKLNDHCCPLYARLLVFRHPQLKDVIELRRRREVGA